ncbi:MAG: hypothetical protein WCF04_11580 [Candidatus Nanopelagicales bacterium]
MSTMKTTSRLLFPTEIGRGDEVWDAHPGQGRWAPVVASAAADQEVLVWCDADPEPLHLSTSRRVKARCCVPAARTGVLDERVDEAPSAPAQEMSEPEAQEAVRLDAGMAVWYSGDLAQARAAYMAHCQGCSDPACCDDVEMEDHLRSWYPGDLGFVINNL